MAASEQMTGLMGAESDGERDGASVDVALSALSRDRFLGHVDACVRQLAAWLGASANERSALPSAERCRTQLWHWLHDEDARLDDGTPIDFALFDAAIQRVGERLPRRGLPGQDKLMQAAWLLAELAYAPAPTALPVAARAL